MGFVSHGPGQDRKEGRTIVYPWMAYNPTAGSRWRFVPNGQSGSTWFMALSCALTQRHGNWHQQPILVWSHTVRVAATPGHEKRLDVQHQRYRTATTVYHVTVWSPLPTAPAPAIRVLCLARAPLGQPCPHELVMTVGGKKDKEPNSARPRAAPRGAEAEHRIFAARDPRCSRAWWRETRRMAEWWVPACLPSRQTQAQVPPRCLAASPPQFHSHTHTPTPSPPTHGNTPQRAGAVSAATSPMNSQPPETWPYCSIHAPSQRATC
ncbi:hypothetical protein COCCADRAFT_31244 [Bipolaris zeicola 26-R-13]|uniref:Uncharacterized protein n=1 Tax=Cochliobolus carbonum (strain 26-R-13) TaxID=930089 RepID=W6XP18_COCC2|nr:uncharacterized protein COCCADRAFT_31244 [Bipolaris zeicola 26-R-13]EUC27223.1 hypothetical protein COCCADRAFT_31244 [Bipolaris zeicola 26-R-13]